MRSTLLGNIEANVDPVRNQLRPPQQQNGHTEDGAVRDTPVLELVEAMRPRDGKHVSRDERSVDIRPYVFQTGLCNSPEGRKPRIRPR
jgi:hypothetical protein